MLDKLPTAEKALFDAYKERDDPLCLPETRVEVRKRIRAWAYGSEDSCIFWLNGMAGTGKSTIARTMAREFHGKGHLGASFFFDRTDRDVAHARFFFTTIAKQLARIGNTALRRAVCDAISEHPDIAQKMSQDQWQKLIYVPLSKLKPSSPSFPLVIVVDALDECDNSHDIMRIIPLLTQAKGLPDIKLRVFVTSRPEMSIQSVFRRPEITHRDLILQDVPREIVDADICLFFYAQFEEVKCMYWWLQGTSPAQEWPGIDNINFLVQAAAGLFIYAATVCRFVKGENEDGEENMLSSEERLALFLPSLHSYCSVGDSAFEIPLASHTKVIDEMYARILENALCRAKTEQNRKLLVTTFQQVVGSIVILSEPLPVPSLARLLGISEANKVYHQLRHYHSVLDVRQDLSAPVRLFHLSFRDYLTSHDRCGNDDFYVDAKGRHEMLTHRCLQLMADLKEDICDLKNPGVLVTEVNPTTIAEHLSPEIQYACRYLTYHAQRSGTKICDDDEVHNFLQNHFLHWLEALSLMGRLADAIGFVEILKSIVLVSGLPKFA